MKHLLSTVIVLSSFLMPSLAQAENAFTPRPLAGGGVAVPTLLSPETRSTSDAAAIRAWKRSLIPVLASQTVDVTSSYGMRELNPLLAGPDGRFGAKATTIKFGATAAVLGVEYLIVRKWPSAGRVFSKLNWGSAFVTGSFAAHNYGIR